MDERKAFLLKMYDQMWNNITRHINLPWQGFVALISSFALFYFSEKSIISLEFSCSIIIVYCTCFICHILDSNNWYFRNIYIISNIERQFLNTSDIEEIHYFFNDHLRHPKIEKTFLIQIVFIVSIIIITSIYYVFKAFIPKIKEVEFLNYLPFIFLFISALSIIVFLKIYRTQRDNLISKSPGKTLNI